MRRLAAFTVLALLTISLPVLGWTLQDCVEVNWDHPDCDQYPTTTTYQTTTTAEATTTTAEVTTTTSDNTTTTQPEVTTTQPTTTTVEQQETTTTTAAPCAEGLIHQPPLCVPPPDDTPINPQIVTVPTTPEGEAELPFTGTNLGMLALSALALLVLGRAMIRKGRTA